MKNQIVHIFRDVNMSYQHDGLIALARQKKIRLDSLEIGEHVLFLNANLNRVKLYSHGGVISYYRAPDKNRVNLNMIEYIPQCFGAKGMDWKQAEKLALDKLLATYAPRVKTGDLVKT